MKTNVRKIVIGLALTALAAMAQTKPSFEVASVKPAAQPDQAKMMALMQAGGKIPFGISISGQRVEYLYMDLKSLVANAYDLKTYQVTAPDWLQTARFDIVAKMPDGSTKDDAPKMLQALLEDRFKLTAHRTSAEHPVLALVAGKGGFKLKPSTDTPVPLDENAPLKPGEMTINQGDGPMRMKMDPTNGSAVIDLGVRGKMSFKMNGATQSIHMDFNMVTMSGFADMLTQFFTQLGGGTGGRQVVDMSEVKGNYDAAMDVSLADVMNMARTQGMDGPGGGGPGGGPGGAGPGGGAPVASDPGGGSASLTDAVKSMGLNLITTKAKVDQLVVDHMEKLPTEN